MAAGDEDDNGAADCADPACATACQAVCGNGASEAAEACDDGNRIDGDGCDNNCTVTACGNGVLTAGEDCDDGNAVNGDGCAANCTFNVSVAQIEYVKASNTGANDELGFSVALSADGSTLAVGARHESSAATGINGDQLNDGASYSGAVYVYTRNGASWIQQAYLKASNTNVFDEFGWSVALSSDGSTLAVGARTEASATTGIDGDQTNNGASYAGAVYVYTRNGTMWSQQAYIKASNTGSADVFSSAIALSGDGSTLAVGAYLEDSAATGINGNQNDNSGTDSGAVYVYTRSGTVWSQEAYIKASNTNAYDFFGVGVALSGDGSTLAVGAFYEDSAATGIDGNQTDNSAIDSGAVYVFTRSGTAWSQQAYVKASNTGSRDLFGYGVALSSDGATLAVGGYTEDSGSSGIDGDQANNNAIDAGAVYVFERSGVVWNQRAYIKASNAGAGDQFGVRVALSSDGSILAICAYFEDSAATGIGGNQLDEAAGNSGAVYVLQRSGTTWSQRAYVKASNTGAGDEFGDSVALSGDGSILAVGAWLEDSAATSTGGNQLDDSATDAGAVYLFRTR